MDLQLDGQHALVTGSTAGIGHAIAEVLAKEGARVIVNGRTQDRVDTAVAQIMIRVPRAHVTGVAADLSTPSGCEKLLAAVPQADILVNNVGIFEPKAFGAIPDEDWRLFFELNVMSGVRLARHYMPQMLERNAGRILFISSESALQIPSEMIHYGVTKTAQLALARGLAELTKGSAVTVNSILPGPTKSEGVGGFVEGLARQQKRHASEVEREFFHNARPSSLLQRFETPEEVADFVAFIASPRSAGVNGASLRVDGGVVRSIA